MHESLHDGIASRVVTTRGDLFNSEVVIHRRYESTHELWSIVASELEWDSFEEDESREKNSRYAFCLAIRKEPEANFSSHKIDRDQDLALGVSMEVDAVFLPRQWELVCIRLSEFEAKPLQPHPTDLTIVTRHDDPFDKIVHLVPVVALSQRASNSFRSDMEQREVFLLDEPLPLFQRNDDSSTSLVVAFRPPRIRLGTQMELQADAPR
jgi:hypothetical protein